MPPPAIFVTNLEYRTPLRAFLEVHCDVPLPFPSVFNFVITRQVRPSQRSSAATRHLQFVDTIRTRPGGDGVSSIGRRAGDVTQPKNTVVLLACARIAGTNFPLPGLLRSVPCRSLPPSFPHPPGACSPTTLVSGPFKFRVRPLPHSRGARRRGRLLARARRGGHR